MKYNTWREVIAIFVDDDYGRGGISALGDALETFRSKISHKVAFPPNADRSTLTNLLREVSLMASRVYVVHVNPDSGFTIFSIAKELGTLASGYAWVATDWLATFLDSFEPADLGTMNVIQGVVAFRHHIPDSDLRQAFVSR